MSAEGEARPADGVCVWRRRARCDVFAVGVVLRAHIIPCHMVHRQLIKRSLRAKQQLLHRPCGSTQRSNLTRVVVGVFVLILT